MTNTIPNVPRELLERLALQRKQDGWLEMNTAAAFAAAKELRVLLDSAPSPDGVDGLEVVADVCGDGLGFLVGVLRSGHLFSAGESLVRLSDAQAIIDGMRGENERIRLNIAEYNEAIACYQSERDQQAQRIGELEGLLREVHDTYRAAIHWEDLRGTMRRIDAALSAGKDSDQ